jgi:hypothetical protein
MKLISMVDFVLADKYAGSPINTNKQYANFLKQPLELWMFVPCDEDGDVLKEPKYFKRDNSDFNNFHYADYCLEYQQAKERCLFEDFEMDNRFVTHKSHASFFYPISSLHEKKIEDLVKYNIQLTPTALKKIGL